MLLLCLTSCTKQEEWLDAKSNRSDVTPTTLKDFQALLDNASTINDSHPGLPLVSCDNYYITTATWLAETDYSRNFYYWKQEDPYAGAPSIIDWNYAYQVTEYANIALDGLNKIPQTTTNAQAWNTCKGTALFYRAFAMFDLLSTFAKPYNAATAATDLGVPIRLSPDINQRSVRSSLAACYTQLINDLKEGAALLPDVPDFQTRPGKLGVYALLARVYLVMGDFANAGLYADKALSGPYKLLDFNTLSASASTPMPAIPNNPEILVFGKAIAFNFPSYVGIADSNLYKSYNANDLRKTCFFTSAGLFKGSYGASGASFAGLALNELYLIRAETLARGGNAAAAMQDLNTLLIKRWKTGTFTPLTATDAQNALDQVLVERRKELPFTSPIRWTDLRRLNTDSRYAVTLTRILNGQTYTLPPGDNRYTLPIPDVEIRLSGIEQNPR